MALIRSETASRFRQYLVPEIAEKDNNKPKHYLRVSIFPGVVSKGHDTANSGFVHIDSQAAEMGVAALGPDDMEALGLALVHYAHQIREINDPDNPREKFGDEL